MKQPHVEYIPKYMNLIWEKFVHFYIKYTTINNSLDMKTIYVHLLPFYNPFFSYCCSLHAQISC